ncbi:MAG: hypothetical protein ACKO3V_15950, partial [Pirellula sp.]
MVTDAPQSLESQPHRSSFSKLLFFSVSWFVLTFGFAGLGSDRSMAQEVDPFTIPMPDKLPKASEAKASE